MLYGPWFEHLLNLKPWDLERMDSDDVEFRLEWIKQQVHGNGTGDNAGDTGTD